MKEGDTITFISESFTETGLIINRAGDKAVVREVEMTPKYYGAGTGFFYPEKVLGIKLEGHSGCWRPECFYEYAIGRKVIKTSKKVKSFKSGLKMNTVKGVVEHKQLGIPAYTFEEDESYVECRRCKIL